MGKPTLYVLIGVPGAGKSTVAKKISEKEDAAIFSSDDIREEWYHDANLQYSDEIAAPELPNAIQKETERRKRKYDFPNPISEKDIELMKIRICNTKVFAELNKRITERLKSGKNAIYDATNVSINNRKHIINDYKSIAKIVGVNVVVDKETAKQRNSQRERKVPEEVIDSMFDRYQTPTLAEGFSEIVQY